MKSLVPFFILWLFCFSVFGQDTIKDDFDFSVINKLREREQNVLKNILSSKKERLKQFEQEALSAQIAEILSSPIYQGHISKGSRIINLLTNEQELVTEDIYVTVHILADSSDYHYLRNENGIVTHKALATDVANVSEVTKMRERPLFYKPVPLREKTAPRIPALYAEFNAHLGFTRPYFTRDLTNDESEHLGEAIRYEAQGYGDFNLPFSVGASLMLENFKGSLGSGENYSVNALSFGPVIKLAPFVVLEQPLISTIGFRSSVFSRMTESRQVETLNYTLAQTSLLLGLQREIKIFRGMAIFGLNFQRQWTKASSDDFNTDLNVDSRYDDSFSFSIGHKTEWL